MSSPSQDGSDGSSRSSGGGRVTRILDTTIKQLGAIAALIGAIAALVVALKPSSTPNSSATQITQQALRETTPQTSTASSTASATNTNASTSPGFQAFTLAQPKLTVRADASNQARATAQLPFHTTVWIVCTRAGDSVTGAASITSTTWDEVRTGRTDPPVGFAPDAWVDTGTTGPTEPSC
jgi:hypothetical protein